MKKLLSIVLAMAMMLSLTGLVVGAAATGDANGDSSVDMKDVLLVRKFIAQMPVTIHETEADVDGDGSVTMKDVLRIRLIIVKDATADPSVVSEVSLNETDWHVQEIASQVVIIVNQRRAEVGLAPLKQNTTLQKAAQVRAKEVVEYFSHERTNGTPFYTVLDEFSLEYSHAGENIALGQRTPEEVMTAWMNSEGHRNNILNPDYTEIGIGYDPEQNAWVQLFMTPFTW